MITQAQVQSARIGELLQEVQAHARVVLSASVLRSDVDLKDAFPDLDQVTAKELREYADKQQTLPRQKFETAFHAVHDVHQGYALYETGQRKQWADLETHIGWRHGHRATLLAMTNVIKDMMTVMGTPAWRVDDDDIQRLELAKSWVRGDVNTKGLLMAYRRCVGDPPIWGALPAERGRRSSYRPPSGATATMYANGFHLGMEELASRVDGLVAALDLDGERGLADVMIELGERCIEVRDENLHLWVNGDRAADERDASQEATRRAADAHRVAGMMAGAWKGALQTPAGNALMGAHRAVATGRPRGAPRE